MRRRDQDGPEPIEDPPVGRTTYPPPAPPPPPPPAPVLSMAQGAVMHRDQFLPPGGELRSGNGRYTFVYQGDGNLVLYKTYPYHERKWLWDSARFSTPGRCLMQGDGNLVVSAAGGAYVWDASTHGNPGAHLAVQDDGNVVIYRADGHALWASNTMQAALPPTGPAPSGSAMEPGQALHPEGAIHTANGTFTLVFQGDGNLVLYRNSKAGGRRALWASNTNGRRAEVCILQGDGNLVIYGPDGEYVWDSGASAPGARLVLQEDGNMVIQAPSGQVIWATDTPRIEHMHSFGDDGWLSVTIRPNGSVRFQGHQRNGNMFAESVDFRVGAFVKFGDYRTLALYQTGHLGTKTSPGGSPIDRKWDRTEYSSLVADHFEEIERSGQFTALQERTGKLSDLLNDVLDGALRWVVGKVLLSTPLGQVILLGAEIASLFGTGSLLPGARFVEGAFWLAGPDGTLYAFIAHGLTQLEDDGKRPLEDWEYKFGQEVFKGTLPPADKMRVTNHKGLGDRPFVFPSLDGILLNLGPDLWDVEAHKTLEDLTDEQKAVWIHELTHAWQIEHTTMTGAWLADAMYSQVCNSLVGDAYAIDRQNMRPFGDYNLEQQAEIVEAWFYETHKANPQARPEDHQFYRYMTEHVWMGRP